MKQLKNHGKIYRFIINILSASPKFRKPLIDLCIKKYALSPLEMCDDSPNSKKNRLRGQVGIIINEMLAEGIIATDTRGQYYLVESKPVAIRIEKCQSEIIKALTESPLSKIELYNRLSDIFGTEKTASTKDDGMLANYIGQFTKKMLNEGALILNDGVYSLAPKVSAKANDINALLTLKSEFISTLYAKGGEFFENYFMSLLKKYSEKHGKKVIECYVTGGSFDGGIDGVIKTEDSLGFKETIMVQTKNRSDFVSETDVRGFYGAVCAKRGTRGIFAATSDFHSSAKDFLDSLDDLIGISGDKIFAMASECLYGICRSGKELTIDEKIFK